MPSFDIVSQVEMQEIDNTINNTRKEVATRYDFRGSRVEIDLDKKAKRIHLVAEDKMKMEALREMLTSNAAKRKVDLKALKFEEPEPTSQGALKRDVIIREGIEQDIAKKIVKTIKGSKIKVQASIQGDSVRVTGKQIDDLQQVMTLMREADFDLPLQFENMKR